jgi:hypothetical protein
MVPCPCITELGTSHNSKTEEKFDTLRRPPRTYIALSEDLVTACLRACLCVRRDPPVRPSLLPLFITYPFYTTPGQLHNYSNRVQLSRAKAKYWPAQASSSGTSFSADALDLTKPCQLP